METKKQMKYLFLLVITTLTITVKGQTIIGQWETYDDNTKEKKAVIEIYENNNRYFAKIVENFVSDKNAVCEKCDGNKKS